MRQLSEEARRILGNRKDQAVLKYLRRMIKVCREKNRREARWEYEHALDFATELIYGALPPRPEYNLRGSAVIPAPEPKPLTAGQIEMRQRPLRKVIATMDDNGSFYLVLECRHRVWEFMLDPAAPPKRRRCAECVEASEAKKQPARAIGRSKAVSA